MRVGFVAWPDGLHPAGTAWERLREEIDKASLHLLITNELPFGNWLAAKGQFDEAAAKESIAIHEEGLASLRKLHVPFVVSSRPVWAGEKLSNEGFAIDREGISSLHHKQLFPSEEGWHETTWYRPGQTGFAPRSVSGLTIGMLLCTELMFNEHARAYGRANCELIAVPRATGLSNEKWFTAGAMAAIVSGAYVISSNRIGQSADGPAFGGRGYAFAPDGTLLAETTSGNALAVIDIDPSRARRQKFEYPCYIRE